MIGTMPEGSSIVSTQPALFIGGGDVPQHLLLKRANRHGLIAGATGTGKTISLRILAEGFSEQGVPVFFADVKGDLAGISQPGEAKPAFLKRAEQIGLDEFAVRGFPAVYWDLLGEQGHPVRTTISEMGPLLLARLLELNDTQEGVLAVAFACADDNGLLLLDLKDLRAMLNFIAENASDIGAQYGNVSKASVGAIQRRLLTLQQQGGEAFFGEPALDIRDMMRVDRSGYGQINVLAADRLMQQPKLYSTFLLWLLSELFEELPEVGDPEKPGLVVFLDEAHLLFEDAPKALLDKIEQVVRLIRSKGVGVFFVTQNPMDIPQDVLGQLGNRVQHALRAFTPRDQKALRAAATTFRQNPAFDAEQVIGELGVGEALVSTLDADGVPSMVQRTLIRPPASRLGTVSLAERKGWMAASPLAGRYDHAVDRDSAHEILKARAVATAAAAKVEEAAPARRSTGGRRREGLMEAMTKSVVRSIGSGLGRQIVRGLLGALSKR
jgi:DNA helicase HerA-like ATPase